MKKIIFIGFPTSGKTTLGKSISLLLNLKFVDLDVVFQNIYILSPKTYIEKYGFTKYRKIEYKLLKKYIELDYDIISTGVGIVENIKSRNILKNLTNVIYLIKDKELLRKDINIRFPNLYKESFDNLYERRKTYFELCSNFKYPVGKLSIKDTIYDFINKFDFFL